MKVRIFAVDEDINAECTGILFWKKIRLGKRFFEFPEDMQKAALSHEFGHHFHYHIEKRLLCIIFAYRLIYDLCKKQELEADLYAAKAGYAKELMKFFKHDFDGGKVHPSHVERRKNLVKYV